MPFSVFRNRNRMLQITLIPNGGTFRQIQDTDNHTSFYDQWACSYNYLLIIFQHPIMFLISYMNMSLQICILYILFIHLLRKMHPVIIETFLEFSQISPCRFHIFCHYPIIFRYRFNTASASFVIFHYFF